MKLNCPECNNEYEQAITLDMSSFFAPASWSQILNKLPSW
jgi:hypothetical protein